MRLQRLLGEAQCPNLILWHNLWLQRLLVVVACTPHFTFRSVEIYMVMVLNSPFSRKDLKPRVNYTQQPLSSSPTCPCVPRSFIYLGECSCGLFYFSKKVRKVWWENSWICTSSHLHWNKNNTVTLPVYIPLRWFSPHTFLYIDLVQCLVASFTFHRPWSSCTAAIGLDFPLDYQFQLQLWVTQQNIHM